jgi:hypothetical protein
MASNFQIGTNKMKLVMENESGTQNVFLSLESVLQNAKQIPQAVLLFVSSLKSIGHIPEDGFLHSHHRENVKSYKISHVSSRKSCIICMHRAIRH